MGSPEADCYLSSPEVVAASAINGFISGPHMDGGSALQYTLDAHEDAQAPPSADADAELIDGFPRKIECSAVACLDDNINTDGIYPGKYTYDESLTGEQQAQVAFENYDTQFASVAKR